MPQVVSRGFPRRGLSLLCLLLLVACGNGGVQADFDDYVRRLERTLDQPASATQPSTLPLWPRSRDLGPYPEDIRLNAAQTLRLVRCGLTNRLAERNSTLARVQAASQRLQPEWEMTVAVEQCIRTLPEDDAAGLQALLLEKRQNWPRFVLRASLASAEMRDFFGLQGVGRVYPEVGRQALRDLRLAVDRALAGRPPPAAEWEGILQRLQESRAGGAVLREQAALTAGFLRANAVMQGFLERRPLCPPGLQPRRAGIMEVIFHKFYAGRIQPAWSGLRRTKDAMNADLEMLAARLGPTLAAPARDYLRCYWSAESPGDRQLQEAAMQHVRLWQKALRQCDMLPGAPVATRTN